MKAALDLLLNVVVGAFVLFTLFGVGWGFIWIVSHSGLMGTLVLVCQCCAWAVIVGFALGALGLIGYAARDSWRTWNDP